MPNASAAEHRVLGLGIAPAPIIKRYLGAFIFRGRTCSRFQSK